MSRDPQVGADSEAGQLEPGLLLRQRLAQSQQPGVKEAVDPPFRVFAFGAAKQGRAAEFKASEHSLVSDGLGLQVSPDGAEPAAGELFAGDQGLA